MCLGMALSPSQLCEPLYSPSQLGVKPPSQLGVAGPGCRVRRVMIEGEDQASVQAWAEEIAEAIRGTLG